MESVYDYKRRVDWILSESAYVFSTQYEARNHNVWLYNADAEVDDQDFTPRADIAEPTYEEPPPPAAATPSFLFLLGDYLALGYGIGEAWGIIMNMPLAFWATFLLLLFLVLRSVHALVLQVVESIICHFGVVGVILLSSTTWVTWPAFLATIMRALNSVDGIIERRLRTLVVCDVPKKNVAPKTRKSRDSTSSVHSRPSDVSSIGEDTHDVHADSRLHNGSPRHADAASSFFSNVETTVSRQDVEHFFREKCGPLEIPFRVSEMRERGECVEWDVQFQDAGGFESFNLMTVLKECAVEPVTQWGSWGCQVRIRPKLGETTAGIEYVTHFLVYLYDSFETRYWVQLTLSIYISLAMVELLVPRMMTEGGELLEFILSSAFRLIDGGDKYFDMEWIRVGASAFLLALIVSFCGYQSWADSTEVRKNLERHTAGKGAPQFDRPRLPSTADLLRRRRMTTMAGVGEGDFGKFRPSGGGQGHEESGGSASPHEGAASSGKKKSK
ncbi:unnamed protein product [Amoebophrya sp. A25]|nr:unnamed protein product [Amoebophrya sp. A25]|eukprot:GSA25T00012589001.1